MAAETSWWQRHIVEGVEPTADGSKATTEALALIGRLDDAVSVLSTVVQRLPTMVDAHLQLARAYRLKRAFVSAERELTLANLMRLTGGRRYDYRPLASPGQREPAIKRWFDHVGKEGGIVKAGSP